MSLMLNVMDTFFWLFDNSQSAEWKTGLGISENDKN